MMSRDDFMEVAWRDFMDWAIRQDFLIAAFEQTTGIKFRKPPKTLLDQLIDKATGFAGYDHTAFIIWATIWHWGEDEAPPLLKAEIARWRAAGNVPDWLQKQDENHG
jgi:hypothetical protein